jgi:hypothetical protein
MSRLHRRERVVRLGGLPTGARGWHRGWSARRGRDSPAASRGDGREKNPLGMGETLGQCTVPRTVGPVGAGAGHGPSSPARAGRARNGQSSSARPPLPPPPQPQPQPQPQPS